MNNIKKTKEGHLETTLRGKEVLSIPTLNKGVAFSIEERQELGLEGFCRQLYFLLINKHNARTSNSKRSLTAFVKMFT